MKTLCFLIALTLCGCGEVPPTRTIAQITDSIQADTNSPVYQLAEINRVVRNLLWYPTIDSLGDTTWKPYHLIRLTQEEAVQRGLIEHEWRKP
jgi:hypothetical protein